MDLCQRVYPNSLPWNLAQLQSHLSIFPDGPFVAIDTQSNAVVGMSASLIIFWEDYTIDDNWKDFTDSGMFTNHDPLRGKTLYASEVMVDPSQQGNGIGKMLYTERKRLVKKMGLLRIRAGARLRNYNQYALQITPDDYVQAVTRGTIKDPTLTFQLRQDFHVLAVVTGYLRNDPESLGFAAVIEWINTDIATIDDYSQWYKYKKTQSRIKKNP